MQHKYKVGDIVYYKGMKTKVIYIDRMGQCMTNIMGYNEWMWHGHIKPIITVKAVLS